MVIEGERERERESIKLFAPPPVAERKTQQSGIKCTTMKTGIFFHRLFFFFFFLTK